MTVVQGVPVHVVRGTATRETVDEEISTDGMLRQRIGQGNRIPARLLRRSATFAEGRKGQLARLALTTAFGIALPIYALLVARSDGDAPCDAPIGPWLRTYGFVGLLMGGIGALVDLRMLSIAHIVERARGIEGDEARAAALAPAASTLAANACLSCCCVLPLTIFMAGWWVKGNFDVWGTYPREGLTWDEPAATFTGCDPALLEGARRLFLVTYVVLGLTLCCCCSICFVLTAAVAAEVEALHDEQGRPHEPRGMV